MSEAQVVIARGLLPPVLGFVALTFLTALTILVTRLFDILVNKRDGRFYDSYIVGGPPSVQRTTRQLANQFEFPMLFLAAICLAVACGVDDLVLRRLAWAYVTLRWAHAAIHLTTALNRLWLRTPVFMLSNLVLLSIWIRLGLRITRMAT